jgi:hypothetical protein
MFRTYCSPTICCIRIVPKGGHQPMPWPGRWLDADLSLCSRLARVKPRGFEVHTCIHTYMPRSADECRCILPTTTLTLGSGNTAAYSCGICKDWKILRAAAAFGIAWEYMTDNEEFLFVKTFFWTGDGSSLPASSFRLVCPTRGGSRAEFSLLHMLGHGLRNRLHEYATNLSVKTFLLRFRFYCCYFNF